MGLFRKKKETTKSCCCGGSCTPEAMKQAEAAKGAFGVKVLGSGCAKCNALESAVREALAEPGMDTTIDHITDFTQIASYGVMTTPALVVDGKVVSYGKVLRKDEARFIIQKAEQYRDFQHVIEEKLDAPSHSRFQVQPQHGKAISNQFIQSLHA